ncbi:hypothetical protein HC251_07250 [Iamia sp. SCSIO 61187]|uniref:Wzz/FepE/Etk N-terminal domain-containing protein n=1 Tax=Iamia sp. SCSIO 61187 TaxID=2722752 RepID=UPI001C6376BA|nr:Wzz/FepE/Etk N-terminal domain-containing protein [Iamia sp. SCSIO 61187]QYG92253.1 hypothetical protein HC251_07250 [Iamia sp. SCSIO 61187]
MELNGLLPVLRRWILVIVIATAIAALIGWRFSSSAEEGYESSAVMLVGPLNTDSDTMRASGSLAQTYAELATSESLLERVAEETGVRPSDLEEGVRATANGTTRFLTIKARADEAATAKAVADAITTDLIDQSREGAVRPEGQLRLIDPASAPERPVTPRGDLVIPLAAVAGLLGAAAIVLLYEFVSDAAETTARVGEATGVAALAVPRRRRWSSSRRQPDPLSVVATQVELAHPEMRCVVVAGAVDRDGTAGIAVALARIWRTRRPVVTVLDATGDVLRPWGGEPEPGAPASDAITEDAARALVEAHTGDGALLIVVTSSPLTSTAALVWAHVADATLLGVRRFTTRLAHVRDAAGNLQATGADVPFVLLHEGRLPAELDPPRARRRAPGPDVPAASGPGAPHDETAGAPQTPATARNRSSSDGGRSRAGSGSKAKGGAPRKPAAKGTGSRAARSRPSSTATRRAGGDDDVDVAEAATG